VAGAKPWVRALEYVTSQQHADRNPRIYTAFAILDGRLRDVCIADKHKKRSIVRCEIRCPVRIICRIRGPYCICDISCFPSLIILQPASLNLTVGEYGHSDGHLGRFHFFVSQETTIQILLTIISVFLRFQILFTSQYCKVTTSNINIRKPDGFYINLKAFLLDVYP